MTGKLSRRLPSWPSCGQAQGQKLSPGDCVLAILIPVDLPKGWLFFFFFLSPICKHPTKLLRPALYCTGRSTEDLHTRHPTLPGRVLNKALSLYIDLLFMLKEAPVFTKLLTGLRPRVLPVLFCCFVFFFPSTASHNIRELFSSQQAEDICFHFPLRYWALCKVTTYILFFYMSQSQIELELCGFDLMRRISTSTAFLFLCKLCGSAPSQLSEVTGF